MYQLFYSPGACSMAVHIILEEVGAEFELIAVSVANRDTQREPYLSINPKGRVPALRIPGETKVLTELPAILRYLASRYPDHGLAQTESPLLAWGFTFAAFWLSLVALMRFGLVGFMAGSFTSMLPFLPITTDPSAWYAGAGFAGLLLILAIAATGFVLSVGGRPLFGRLALEE